MQTTLEIRLMGSLVVFCSQNKKTQKGSEVTFANSLSDLLAFV